MTMEHTPTEATPFAKVDGTEGKLNSAFGHIKIQLVGYGACLVN